MLGLSFYRKINIIKTTILFKNIYCGVNNNVVPANNICSHRLFSNATNQSKNLSNKEELLIKNLNQIIDPCVNKTIETTGYLQNVSISKLTNRINITLDLYINGHPNALEIKQKCIDKVIEILNVKEEDIHVHIIHQCTNNSNIHMDINSKPTILSSLSKIKHIIAVSSCKGGVGKSTIAYKIANELANRHNLSMNANDRNNPCLRVGLLDADIYGPSVPYLATPIDHVVRKASSNSSYSNSKNRYQKVSTSDAQNNDTSTNNSINHINMVEPLVQKNGLKLMSFGYVNPKAGVAGAGQTGGAAVLRGPVVTKVINQLIIGTNWGELDYLVIDMPPGTGDIPITVCQTIPLSGAVIVTTPHVLSITDVIKGIEMFENVKVPTLSIIENMSHMTCAHGEVYYPFGMNAHGKNGLLDILKKNSVTDKGIDKNGSLHETLHEKHRDILQNTHSSYHQVPIVCNTYPKNTNSEQHSDIQPLQVPSEKEMSAIFEDITNSMLKNIVNTQINAQLIPNITTNTEQTHIILRYYTPNSAVEYKIPCIELRYLRDASTGTKLPEPVIDNGNATPYPTHYEYKGNYGVNIHWNDGYATDIYSYECLKRIAIELNE